MEELAVIPWEDGNGNIVVTGTGEGSDTPSVASDASNDSLDREQSITFKTTEGSPQATVERTVRQSGLREKFITADSKVFAPADADVFGVLKE